MVEGKVFQSTIHSTRFHCKFVFKKKRTIRGKRAHGSSPLGIWSKGWVCGLLLSGIVCLSTVEGMDVAC